MGFKKIKNKRGSLSIIIVNNIILVLHKKHQIIIVIITVINILMQLMCIIQTGSLWKRTHIYISGECELCSQRYVWSLKWSIRGGIMLPIASIPFRTTSWSLIFMWTAFLLLPLCSSLHTSVDLGGGAELTAPTGFEYGEERFQKTGKTKKKVNR